MHKHFLIVIIILAMISSCNKKESADLIIHNAVVYTVDSTFSIASAVAVKDGKILFVGENEDVLGRFSASKVIDAEGKAVFPGFIDGHCHFTGLGETSLRYVDLNGCRSFEELLERVKQHVERFDTEWVLGRGWDQNLWPDKDFPTNEVFPTLFPGKKIALTRIDGHAGLVSDEVLDIIGFSGDTKIDGGEIIVNTEGNPTGILLDNAYDIARGVIPPMNKKEQKEALLRAQELCFSKGLTSVTDAGLSKEQILLIDSLQEAKVIKIKVNAMINPDEETMNYFMGNGIMVKDRLSVRSIKLYADGALGSRGARLIEPYSDDPGNYGLFVADDAYYKGICDRALKSGFQVCTHAIGDAGVRKMLTIYSSFLGGKNDLRWRIEHSQVVAPEDFVIYGEYSIIPSIQSTHATSDMRWAIDRLGPERIKTAYAQKVLLEQNGWLINGTDFPIENVSPIYTFYAAVARKDLQGEPAEGFQMENALSRDEALRSVTIWAAKGAFEESRKGNIEIGKDADMVILSDDIMTIDEGKLPEVKILKLFISGEEVY
ncbi:MAG: amidohydrolase [Bacteroidales bacterium]|nr:amidohydrolase [Bacteroidales bacterium]